MAEANFITAQELRDRLSYDSDTGIFRWRRHLRAPSKNGQEVGSWDLHGYKTIRLDRRSYKLHRLAWLYVYGVWPTGDIDHINGVRSDNRIANLRDVPRKLNLENQRTAPNNGSTGLLGAYFDKRRGTYYSRISHHNKIINLGTFGTAQEAHRAYVKAKRRIHEGCTL